MFPLPNLAPVVAEAHEAEPIVWTPERGREEAYRAADRYDLSSIGLREAFVRAMSCESADFKDPAIQSGHFKGGRQERSFGYAQWNLDAHPHITMEQATDPIWALDRAAYEWSVGNKNMWTCASSLR